MTHEQAEAHLTGDDDMANRFLRNAADAIVARSTLSRDVATLTSKLSEVSSVADTLTEIKRTQEERIALLEAQLASAQTSEADTFRKYQEALDTITDRQNSINLLDQTVADLENAVKVVGDERNTWQAKSELQASALDKLVGQINDINRVLGRPDLDPDPREEIEAACAESPSESASEASGSEHDDHAMMHDPVESIGDGLDSPTYRREVADDSTRVEYDYTDSITERMAHSDAY